MASENIGRVIQVIGPVVDIEFPQGVPAIYNAVNIEGGKNRVVVEVEQHLGENRVRCVSMQPTEGMVRGMVAKDTGDAIMVPVGPGTLGRVLNVLGEPVDEFGPVKSDKRYPIHRPAPAFDQQSTKLEMFETGIKVIDLIEPYLRGGQDWPLRWRRRRQDGHHSGTHLQPREEARRRLRVRGGRGADPRGQRSLA